MMIKKDVVVGIGEVLWDLLPQGKQIGGAPANFAYHVSQFGLNGCVASAVGNDLLGTEIIENFKDKGLNCIIERISYPTGTVQVEIDDAGIPKYEITKRSEERRVGIIYHILLNWKRLLKIQRPYALAR